MEIEMLIKYLKSKMIDFEVAKIAERLKAK